MSSSGYDMPDVRPLHVARFTLRDMNFRDRANGGQYH